MLFNPFKSVIGLDIGDETVKAVRLDLHRLSFKKIKTELVSYAEERLPDGSMFEGEIVKPEEVLHAVKKVSARTACKHKIPWVVCALPETKTFIKLLSIPVKKEMLSLNTIYEVAKKELPIPFNESYLDWQLMPHISNQSETKILLGAVLKKTADAYTYLLNIAGLTPLALEVEAMSITRTSLPPNSSGTHLILDIGQTSTTFIMYSNQTIQFTLSFEFSGNLLTERIQRALSCTEDEAERIKILCGMDFENCICHKQGQTKVCNIKEVMEKSMDELASYVQKGISFFSEHFSEAAEVDSIILSGGSGQMLFFDKELSKRAGKPVVRGNPLARIRTNTTLAKESSRPYMRFNTAIGLGLRGLHSPLGI